MGKLEGSNGSTKLVQSLWAGAQQLSTDYMSPPRLRLLSSNDRDGVAVVVVVMHVVVVVIIELD